LRRLRISLRIMPVLYTTAKYAMPRMAPASHPFCRLTALSPLLLPRSLRRHFATRMPRHARCFDILLFRCRAFRQPALCCPIWLSTSATRLIVRHTGVRMLHFATCKMRWRHCSSLISMIALVAREARGVRVGAARLSQMRAIDGVRRPLDDIS